MDVPKSLSGMQRVELVDLIRELEAEVQKERRTNSNLLDRINLMEQDLYALNARFELAAATASARKLFIERMGMV